MKVIHWSYYLLKETCLQVTETCDNLWQVTEKHFFKSESWQWADLVWRWKSMSVAKGNNSLKGQGWEVCVYLFNAVVKKSQASIFVADKGAFLYETNK